jgi:hypothetical protein
MHPSKIFRAKNYDNYLDHNREYFQNLANLPEYAGQFVNGYFQTTDASQRSFLHEDPNVPLVDNSIKDLIEPPRPPDEMKGRFLDKPPKLPALFLSEVDRFRVWEGQEYQVSDRSAPNYLSLKDFAKVDVLKNLKSDSWQAEDRSKPFYMPSATLDRYRQLLNAYSTAVDIQKWNAREATLALQEVRERSAQPQEWNHFTDVGDYQSIPDSPRLPGWWKMAAAAAVLVLLVIVVAVALANRNNDGHQKFSPQPAQGLWGYDWKGPFGWPR